MFTSCVAATTCVVASGRSESPTVTIMPPHCSILSSVAFENILDADVECITYMAIATIVRITAAVGLAIGRSDIVLTIGIPFRNSPARISQSASGKYTSALSTIPRMDNAARVAVGLTDAVTVVENTPAYVSRFSPSVVFTAISASDAECTILPRNCRTAVVIITVSMAINIRICFRFH